MLIGFLLCVHAYHNSKAGKGCTIRDVWGGGVRGFEKKSLSVVNMKKQSSLLLG